MRSPPLTIFALPLTSLPFLCSYNWSMEVFTDFHSCYVHWSPSKHSRIFVTNSNLNSQINRLLMLFFLDFTENCRRSARTRVHSAVLVYLVCWRIGKSTPRSIYMTDSDNLHFWLCILKNRNRIKIDKLDKAKVLAFMIPLIVHFDKENVTENKNLIMI